MVYHGRKMTFLVLAASFISSLGSYLGISVNEFGDYTPVTSSEMASYEFDDPNRTRVTSSDMSVPNRRNLGFILPEEKEVAARNVNLTPWTKTNDRKAFWSLYNQMDDNKVGNSWTAKESDKTRPTLTNFRYIILPIVWSDEEPFEGEELTKYWDYIKGNVDYNKQYYDEMSFGNFQFDDPIMHDQIMLKDIPSNPNPVHYYVEEQVVAYLEKKGYKHPEHYDGIGMFYRVTEGGYFAIRGGFANLNADRKLFSRCCTVVNH